LVQTNCFSLGSNTQKFKLDGLFQDSLSFLVYCGLNSSNTKNPVKFHVINMDWAAASNNCR
jgi:hypothetical protein